MKHEEADDVTRVRFRRRLRLAAMLGLVGGLVVCLHLEATAPLARARFAWRQPSAPSLAAELLQRPTVETLELDDSDKSPDPLANVGPQLRLDALQNEGGRAVVPLRDGSKAVLTLDPVAQDKIRDLLERHRIPFASVVALDPRTGDVKAWVEVATENPSLRGLARKAIAPAASVFKIVTAAALVERAGLTPETRVRSQGGRRGIAYQQLVDVPEGQGVEETLADAFGRSRNAAFALLSDRHLDPVGLRVTAEAFGWQRPIPFVWPVEISSLRVPFERVERARTAAGFWNSRLSPVHGALVAAGVANDGVMMKPRLVNAVLDGQGRPVADLPGPSPWLRAVSRDTARALDTMMRKTTGEGTAASFFADGKRPENLQNAEIAGKTGSLTSKGERPFHFSWFVGYAPADDPQIAVAVLVVSDVESGRYFRAAKFAWWSLNWLTKTPG